MMSKENLLIVKEVEDDDPEMWQFEHSAIIASDFINDVLLETMKTRPNINLVNEYLESFSGGSRKYNINYNQF